MINQEKFYNMAKSLLGENLAPGNEALGCAISMSAIHNKAFPELPALRFVNTSQWLEWVESRPDLWERLTTYDPKALLIYATKEIPKGSPLKHGHIHIIGQFTASDGSLYTISNNSKRGVLDTHITLRNARDYFETYGKLSPHIFRRLG